MRQPRRKMSNRDPCPPCPLRSAFCDFFGVGLTLEYGYMCSEADFTQDKSHFYPTTKITIPPYCLLLFCRKMVE